jgi:thiol-disulfide isomerase/thioredoxin
VPCTRIALGTAAGLVATLVALGGLGHPLAAQVPSDLAREREAYAAWLATTANSPFAAVAVQPVGAGLRLGPADADIPLAGVAEHRVTQSSGVVALDGPGGRRTLARDRSTPLGRYTLALAGAPDRAVLTVFGARRAVKAPEYYSYDPSLALDTRLTPPEHPATVRVLAPDGVEVDAQEAGTIEVQVDGASAKLLVRRLPGEESGESELLVYFRDETNGHGTYPAGRFVLLLPKGGDRYRLDLNRAGNPFCAYSPVYPCPAPWRGNTIAAPVSAGERYGSGAPQEEVWRAALELAGGELRFALKVEGGGAERRARLCNGRICQPTSGVKFRGDSIEVSIADYAASIEAAVRGDSLVGAYRNVGNRGPRVIPFRASRGRWPSAPAPLALLGRWDATFYQDLGTSPRVFDFRNGPAGFEGTMLSNTGDYGHFAGAATGDSFALAHFDGSFVYLLTGRLRGDTLRGVFHAGLRSETPWTAVRSTGAPHLKSPTEITKADTSEPFRFAFPDLTGRKVTEHDARFRGKVMLVDVFGSWCPTCHDAAPDLVRLYRRYHKRGLEIVGLAYEVTGDSATDAAQVRRFRNKFGITYPLLLAGINDTDAAAATLPQLQGFTSFPTTIFLGRDGKVRRVHAGFYGPSTGEQHQRLVREFEREIERLLAES